MWIASWSNVDFCRIVCPVPVSTQMGCFVSVHRYLSSSDGTIQSFSLHADAHWLVIFVQKWLVWLMAAIIFVLRKTRLCTAVGLMFAWFQIGCFARVHGCWISLDHAIYSCHHLLLMLACAFLHNDFFFGWQPPVGWPILSLTCAPLACAFWLKPHFWMLLICSALGFLLLPRHMALAAAGCKPKIHFVHLEATADPCVSSLVLFTQPSAVCIISFCLALPQS